MTTQRARIFLLCVTVMLYALALFPGGGQANHGRGAWQLGVGISGAGDVASNLLLFVPFGVVAAIAFGAGTRRPALLVVCSAVVISFSIEMLQTFIPSRFPSLIDVAANTAGAMIGFAGCQLWRTRRSAPLLALYLAFAYVFTLLLQPTARLTRWDEAYPLVLGNEATGDRLWSGRLWRVDIADRFVGSSGVHDLLKGADPGYGEAVARVMGDNLVASYDFASADPCLDSTGHLPPLVWNNGKECGANGTAAQIGYQGWLRTGGAAQTLTDRIRRKGQFTLAASFESANNWQIGPARIVSLSKDADRRNFTLGQTGADFIVRLRTPLGGQNGAYFELVARNAVRAGRRQTVAVTYDGARLSIFVDDPRPRASIEFGPGLALAAKLGPQKVVATIAPAVPLELLYFAAIFLGLGVLVELVRKNWDTHDDQ